MILPGSVERVKEQYEEMPYPQIPILAGVETSQLYPLYLGCMQAAAYGVDRKNYSPKILIVGCGTFEPLAVAKANPGAHITALDLSASSLKILKNRMRWHRTKTGITFVQADIATWEPENDFDLIIATGVLHHLPDPRNGLINIRKFLKNDGILRALVYSPYGREAIYRWQKIFRTIGIRTHREAIRFVNQLPADHPQRIQFYLYSDYANASGFRDGFSPEIDHAFSAVEWEKILRDTGFITRSFLHPNSGQPESADPLLTNDTNLSDWQKIQLLDCLGELETNYQFLAVPDAAPAKKNIEWYVPYPHLSRWKNTIWDRRSQSFLPIQFLRKFSEPMLLEEIEKKFHVNGNIYRSAGLLLPIERSN